MNTSIENLKWTYPIKAFTVINAIGKSSPLLLECPVRKRLEKRVEVLLALGAISNQASLNMRSLTPIESSSIDGVKDNLVNKPSNFSNSLTNNEFIYSIQFGESHEMARNAIAVKLIKIERDQSSDSIALTFSFIYCPSKSFVLVFILILC
jgi:hypothetical protein